MTGAELVLVTALIAATVAVAIPISGAKPRETVGLAVAYTVVLFLMASIISTMVIGVSLVFDEHGVNRPWAAIAMVWLLASSSVIHVARDDFETQRAEKCISALSAGALLTAVAAWGLF